MFRVFPKRNTQNGKEERNGTDENTLENRLLQQEVKHLREQLDKEREIVNDLRRPLDAEGEERRKVTMMLITHEQEKKRRNRSQD